MSKRASFFNRAEGMESIEFSEVGFLTETNENQMETIAAVYQYGDVLKKKIYYSLDNYGLTGSVSVDEVFNNFLDQFVQKPEYAFDDEYSDDPEYYEYPYIVKRLEYFMIDVNKNYFKKSANEVRIYEGKMEKGDKIPRKSVAQDQLPGCNRSKQAIDAVINDFYVEDAFRGMKELSEYYQVNILDYLLLEAKSTMIDKALTAYEMDTILGTDIVSDLKKSLGVKNDKNDCSEEEVLAQIAEIDRNSSLEIKQGKENSRKAQKFNKERAKLLKKLYDRDCAKDAQDYLKSILTHCTKNQIDIFGLATFDIDEAVAKVRQ